MGPLPHDANESKICTDPEECEASVNMCIVYMQGCGGSLRCGSLGLELLGRACQRDVPDQAIASATTTEDG